MLQVRYVVLNYRPVSTYAIPYTDKWIEITSELTCSTHQILDNTSL